MKRRIKKWWNNQEASDKVATVVGTVIVVYLLLCWLNVITHNSTGIDYTYPWWNIFKLF